MSAVVAMIFEKWLQDFVSFRNPCVHSCHNVNLSRQFFNKSLAHCRVKFKGWNCLNTGSVAIAQFTLFYTYWGLQVGWMTATELKVTPANIIGHKTVQFCSLEIQLCTSCGINSISSPANLCTCIASRYMYKLCQTLPMIIVCQFACVAWWLLYRDTDWNCEDKLLI